MAEVAEADARGVRELRRRHDASSPSTRRSPPSRTATTRRRSSFTADLINPFLVESGLTEEEAAARRPLRPELHRRPTLEPERVTVAADLAAVVDASGRRPTRRAAPRGSAGTRGRRQRALGRLRGDIPPALAGRRSASLGVGRCSSAAGRCRRRLGIGLVPRPDPGRDVGRARVELVPGGRPGRPTCGPARRASASATRSAWPSASCSASLIGSFRSVEAFFEPQIGFLRYIPATALDAAVPALARHRRGAEDRAHRRRARSSTTS